MQQISLQELMHATGGRLKGIHSGHTQFHRISIDSREVRPGDVFWAISGQNHDGHDFADAAIQQGACLCVASAYRADSLAGPVLIVDETLAALGRFASWYRNQLDALVIGVTGSVGKTTTRELIYAALSEHYSGIRSRQNFNNRIGLPLSLLDLQSSHEFAVIEMGASQPGDIRTLCELASPEIGVVTAIGPAHLQSFGSIAAIIQTKGELLEQLPTSGFAILPGDEATTRQMADLAPCPVIFVGEGAENHVRATRIEEYSKGLRFRCDGVDFDVLIHGRHVLSSVLCGIAIGLEIGVPVQSLVAGLAKFTPAPGRCSVEKIGPWTVINDTYNASPLSVAAGCRLLQEMHVPGNGHRLLVLGDMRELGETAKIEHEHVGQLAAQLQFDRLLVCGEHANDVVRGAMRFGMKAHQIASAPDIDALQTVLDCWLEPGDLLMVKGSRAMRMERILDWLRILALAFEPLSITIPITCRNRICA